MLKRQFVVVLELMYTVYCKGIYVLINTTVQDNVLALEARGGV